MNFHARRLFHACRFGLGFFGAFLGTSVSLHASYILANVNLGAGPQQCASVNPIDPGEPCAGFPHLLSVGVSFSGTGVNSSAYTEYGVNKAYVQTSAIPETYHAVSEWQVNFTLAGGTLGQSVPLSVDIGYDVFLAAGSDGNARLVLNNDTFSPVDFLTTTNPFGNDVCPGLGTQAPGTCAGTHTGTVTRPVTYQYGPNNRMSLTLGISGSYSSTIDAANTVRILKIVVPDGVTWDYQGITGNPLNFQYASTGGEVPEPSAWTMALLGIGAVWIGNRVRR
jgi:hypothetical protein